jgi:hypothetical protein
LSIAPHLPGPGGVLRWGNAEWHRAGRR